MVWGQLWACVRGIAQRTQNVSLSPPESTSDARHFPFPLMMETGGPVIDGNDETGQECVSHLQPNLANPGIGLLGLRTPC